MIYPVITLYQPWATWIMRKWKLIETRTHDRFACLKHKEFLIHAGMKTDDSDLTIKNPYLTQNHILYNPEEMINGHILGKVYAYDFTKLNERDSELALIDCKNTPRYGLFFNPDDIIKFQEPIPCKGEMGIWYYDLDKKEKVKKPTEPTKQILIF